MDKTTAPHSGRVTHPLLQEILQTVRDNPQLTYRQIATQFNITHWQSVQQYATKAGIVRKRGRIRGVSPRRAVL